MKVAKGVCGKGSFRVRGGARYTFCATASRSGLRDWFQATSKADWKNLSYLDK